MLSPKESSWCHLAAYAENNSPVTCSFHLIVATARPLLTISTLRFGQILPHPPTTSTINEPQETFCAIELSRLQLALRAESLMQLLRFCVIPSLLTTATVGVLCLLQLSIALQTRSSEPPLQAATTIGALCLPQLCPTFQTNLDVWVQPSLPATSAIRKLSEVAAAIAFAWIPLALSTEFNNFM